MTSNSSKPQVLSEEELKHNLTVYYEGAAGGADRGAWNEFMRDLIHSQKTAYAESLINDLISQDAFSDDFKVKDLLKTIRRNV